MRASRTSVAQPTLLMTIAIQLIGAAALACSMMPLRRNTNISWNQRQMRHQALELRVLFTQLPQFPQLGHPQVRITLLPDIARRLADPQLPTHIRYRCVRLRLRLSRRICNLFIAES